MTLVHGPRSEVRRVRRIFDLCLKKKSSAEIARELNGRRAGKCERIWKSWMIDRILTNPIYAGTYVWNRTSQRLRTKVTLNKSRDWIVKRNAFPAIVSQAAFDRAQRIRHRENYWTDAQLLDKLRRLLAKRGYLSERLIQNSSGPSLATFYRRLGTFERIYQLVGFKPGARVFQRSKSRGVRLSLKSGLFRQIEALFPGRVKRFRLPSRIRELLCMVIAFCRSCSVPLLIVLEGSRRGHSSQSYPRENT